MAAAYIFATVTIIALHLDQLLPALKAVFSGAFTGTALEKTPRATPFWIAILTVAPAKPPMAAVPVKAPEKTDFKAGSNWSRCQSS